MSTVVYPKALEGMLSGTVNVLDGDDVKVTAVDSSYVYVSTHEFLSDITGQLGSPATLTGKAVTAGVFTADQPSISGVDSPDLVKALIYYLDTGTPSTSRLLVFDDESPGAIPLNYAGDSTDILVILEGGNRICTI